MALMNKSWKTYYRIVMARAPGLFAPLVRMMENVYFGANKPDVKPPIFIVGAPRTGSTILYQALTNAFQLAYIDNVACTWHRNLRFGLWLSRKKYGNKPHNNFKAQFGNTSKFGGHSPSECGQFWYRWLPKNRHFIDYHEITDGMVEGVRREVLGASAFLEQPLVFKNLNVGQRLRLIREAFPEAKIIFVRRDPRFVVRSILQTRKKVGVGEGQWWSVMPPNVSDLLNLTELEMCAAQVYHVERQIEEDLTLFPAQNTRQVHYQSLDNEVVDDLGKWIAAPRRAASDLPEFRHDQFQSLTDQELKQWAKIIEKYPFEKELFV